MSAVPVQKPIVVTRPRPQLRVEQGARTAPRSKVGLRAFAFGMTVLAVFFGSSLAGQVMVEKARGDGIRATERLKSAAKEEALLRDQVQSMTKASAVAAWAQENGFVPLESLVAEGVISNGEDVH